MPRRRVLISSPHLDAMRTQELDSDGRSAGRSGEVLGLGCLQGLGPAGRHARRLGEIFPGCGQDPDDFHRILRA